MPVPNRLRETGSIQLCRAQRGEYKKYLAYLDAAVTLSAEDVNDSLAQAHKSCGDQLEFLNVPRPDAYSDWKRMKPD
jgi:hypothetical protein